MSADSENELSFLRTLSGRTGFTVVLLVVAALTLFAYNLSVLGELGQSPEVELLERLQWGFALGALAAGGLILFWINDLVRRERRADRDARLRAIIDTTSDGIITIDEKGLILDFNRSAERLFGYSASEVLGKNVAMLTPEEHAKHHDGYLERYHRTGEKRIIDRERHEHGRRSDGTEFPISLRVSELKMGGKRTYVGIILDRTTTAQRERLMETTREVLTELVGASSELLATASEQAASAQEQSAAVTETVVTAEEVSQTSRQAADRARAVADSTRAVDELGQAGRQAVHEAVRAIGDAREQGEGVARNMLELAERAQAIGRIIGTVDEIAEQTNLLALNAAIEASRAGEQGRGFAVVAAEVKALARRSKEATVEVREILGEIQKATNAAVLAGERGARTMSAAVDEAGEAGNSIDSLTETLGTATDAASQIAASAGQQATGMAQINQAMKDIDGALRDHLDAIKHVERAAGGLKALSERIDKLLVEYEGRGDD
jgi:PAS domain S-box-containing protein